MLNSLQTTADYSRNHSTGLEQALYDCSLYAVYIVV
jgi:hypothetical protein